MSYLTFYGLNRQPFHVTPDPEFLFLSPSHKEALGTFLYGISKRKGILAVTGEVGVGKTTVLRSYLGKLHRDQVKLIYLFNPNISFSDLVRILCEELGVSVETDHVPELLDQLHQSLIQEYAAGRNVVLVVDEAQNIPYDTMENLRMLSNLETETDKLLQIVLIGQPELEQKLSEYRLRQLRQRIAVRSTIVPLTEAESVEYIESRLTRCHEGRSAGPIFSPPAMKAIIRASEGIPRVINILCDNALITGFAYQRKPIDLHVAKEVIADFYGRPVAHYKQWVATAALVIFMATFVWLFFRQTPELVSAGTIQNSDLNDRPRAAAAVLGGMKPVLDTSTAATVKLTVQAAPKKGKNVYRSPRIKTIQRIEAEKDKQAERITLERSRKIQLMIQQNHKAAINAANRSSLSSSEPVVKPAVLRTVNPAYPRQAIEKGYQGTVLLNVLVSAGGEVEAIQILKGIAGAPSLSDAAMAAVRRWKFSPGMRNGIRESMWITCAIAFDLD